MRVVVHIGLHKTASTTLQQQVFRHLHYINYVDLDVSDARSVIYKIQVQDPIYFNGAEARELLAKALSPTKLNLISAESLSGSLNSAIGKKNLDHRHSILENLYSALPDAMVLLVLRRQDQYAKAVYRQYLKRGGVVDPTTYFGRNPDDTAYFPRDRFRYLEYVDALLKKFPSGVHVFAYEDFVESPTLFLKNICEFLQIPPQDDWRLKKINRTRLGTTGMAISRQLNRFFRSTLNPGGILPGITRKHYGGSIKSVSPVYLLHDSWPGTGTVRASSELGRLCTKLLTEQKASNRLLQERIGLDLHRHGYW